MRETSGIVVRPDSVVRLDGNRIVRTPVSKWPKAQDEWVYMLSQSYDKDTHRVYTVVTAWDGHNGTLVHREEVQTEHHTFAHGTRLAKAIVKDLIWLQAQEKSHEHERTI